MLSFIIYMLPYNKSILYFSNRIIIDADKVNKKKKRKVKKYFKCHNKLIHNDVKHKKKKHVSDSSTESETESYTQSTGKII